MRILWIPHTGWHIPQRAHLFCRALAERHEVHVSDSVADFTNLGDYFSTRYIRNFSYRQYMSGNITVHGIPRISPALYLPFLRKINNYIYSRYIEEIIKKESIEAVVGTFVVSPPSAKRLIFDLFDENVYRWRLSKRTAQYAEEIEEVEQSYFRQADAIVAASSVLLDKVKDQGVGQKGYLIPNPINLLDYQFTRLNSYRSKLLKNDKFLVGSVGNHDNFDEVKKVIEIAAMFQGQGVKFLIAGRGSAVKKGQELVQKAKLDNVVFLGYIPLTDVKNVIAALDVGLCPYNKTPMDDARSPMRLLAYAASGIPTVCTDLLEVRRLGFSNVILVQDTAEASADGIRKAITMPRQQPAGIERFDIHRLVAQYEAVIEGRV